MFTEASLSPISSPSSFIQGQLAQSRERRATTVVLEFDEKEELLEDEPVYQGYINKTGFFNTGWRQRYCILKHDQTFEYWMSHRRKDGMTAKIC